MALSWDAHEPVAVWVQPGHNLPILSIKSPRSHLALRFLASGQKARRSELVPIAPEFAVMLERVPESKRQGPVFPLPTSSRNNAGRRIVAIAAEAGVYVDDAGEKPAGAHDLRRAFGTRWAPESCPRCSRS